MLLGVVYRPSEKIRGGYWLYLQLDKGRGSQMGNIRGIVFVSQKIRSLVIASHISEWQMEWSDGHAGKQAH